jgi:hypothetical protein
MYSKLFTKVLDSSIWLESHPTRIVWMTMLACMDEDGMCQFATVVNLARRAIVTTEEARQAISILEAPDLDSSDPDNEGRRLERVPGGWIVLNATKYKDIVTGSESRRLARERAQRYRDKKKAGITPKRDDPKPITLPSCDERDAVPQSNGAVTQLEKEKEKEKDTDTKTDTKPPKRDVSPVVAFVLPPWVGKEAWTAYEQMRKAIKKPMTLRARELVLNKLASFEGRGLSSTDSLNQSVVNSWADVYEPKQQNGARTTERTGRTVGIVTANKSQQRSDGNMEALASVLSDTADFGSACAYGGDAPSDSQQTNPQSLLDSTCQ